MEPTTPVGKVCLSRLSPALKKRVWDFIQKSRPELASLLTDGDPQFPVERFKTYFPGLVIWVAAADTGLTLQELQDLKTQLAEPEPSASATASAPTPAARMPIASSPTAPYPPSTSAMGRSR